MKRSVKNDAAEKAIELGPDDLEAISGGGMSRAEFKRLTEKINKYSEWEKEEVSKGNWAAANSYKRVREDLINDLKQDKIVIAIT